MEELAYSENLVWIDLEMTGLDPEVERIIEIAVIVSDSSLKVLAEGPVVVVKQPDALLEAMDDWNTAHHTASGLVDLVRSEGIAESEAEQESSLFEFFNQEPICRRIAFFCYGGRHRVVPSW